MVWEVSFLVFLFVTVALGGGAAWMTGRSVARSWQGNVVLIVYIVLLAGAARFIHFSLFNGTLLSVYYYAVDLLVLLAISFASKRYMRSEQMETQYAFEYVRSGIFGWKRRG